MMIEEPVLHKIIMTQIIEGVLGGLESEGSKLAVVTLKVGEEIATTWRWSMKSRMIEASRWRL